MRGKIAYLGLGLVGLASTNVACSKKKDFDDKELAAIQSLSPLPDTPVADPSNAYADDVDAATLGQMFFFETGWGGVLKTDSYRGKAGDPAKINCASCHVPQTWFQEADGFRNSIGTVKTPWNNLTLVNVGFNEWPYWTGRKDNYWSQAAAAVEHDLGGSRLSVAHVLYAKYRDEYNALFDPDLDPDLDVASPSADRFPPTGRPKMSPDDEDGAWEMMDAADQDAITRVMANVGKSIHAFTRTIISRDAPFDRFVAGEDDAISASAKRGLKLFIGDALCADCHAGPTFSDYEFHNLGVPQLGDADLGIPDEDTGFFKGLQMSQKGSFTTTGPYSDDPYKGKFADSDPMDESHMGQFRTQPLRNIAKTGPFMHAGQLETLKDVVIFYNEGGGAQGFAGTKDDRIQPLDLSDKDIDDLVAFLETLTGEPVPADRMEDTHKP